MHLIITTKVEAEMATVKEGFTEELFLALNPPFPKVQLLEFGGCKAGDMVSIKLKFPFFSQIWKSEIYADSLTDTEWYFADRGVELPFFLKTWNHRHVVCQQPKGSLIIDDINYTSGLIIADWLLYPVLLGQFLYRKPKYKNWFKQ